MGCRGLHDSSQARSCLRAPMLATPGSATDSPDTARSAVLQLHKGWVQVGTGC